MNINNLFFKRYPNLSYLEDKINDACNMIISSYTKSGKLLVCGNGGSASDSEHIVGELMKSFIKNRPLNESERNRYISVSNTYGQIIADNLQGALPAISLVSQTSLLTAFSNDVNPNMIFAQQVHGYGHKNDVFLGISTSGESKNVVLAALVAKAKGLATISLTGESNSTLMEICDITINVPSTSTYEIQEYHLPIYHLICQKIESEFFNV